MDGALFLDRSQPHTLFPSLLRRMDHSLNRRSLGSVAWFLSIGLLAHQSQLAAQAISGRIEQGSSKHSHIRLGEVLGSDHTMIDSVAIDRRGWFRFPHVIHPAGFYMLALNDTDQVDIILDPREEHVEVHFSGTPLQSHIAVLRSTENQRLWEYKWISKECQARFSVLREERRIASPQDRIALQHLDSMEALVKADQRRALDRLVEQDPTSYFAHVVKADLRLMNAVPSGSQAIAASFDWSDPRILRSSVYPKAIVAYLESVAADTADGFIPLCDSLLTWARSDTACWRYTRLTLIRLFDQFGPDHITQYLVDHYVAGGDALLPPEKELQALIEDLLRVSIGARAPAVVLRDLSGTPPVNLIEITRENRFTAVFFYSSTCDHCHDQMPGLLELYSEFGERDFGIIGVALDTDTSEFRSTIEVEHLVWPSYTDLLGWGSPAAKAFAVKSTPSIFLLDQAGRIIDKPYDHVALRKRLEALLP